MQRRKIGIVTTSRADYGIYRPILDALRAERRVEYTLYVSGTHLSPQHGNTVELIEKDGHPIADRIHIMQPSDTPSDIARSMGAAVEKFGQSYARHAPDILLVLGDRYEMLGAVMAAVPFNIPIAHVHGGEVSEGAIDDVFRHAITKASHLHFPATKLSAQRIAQMGEDTKRIFLCGAPGLDNMKTRTLLPRDELAHKFGIWPDRDYLLVTYHPVTREYQLVEEQIEQLLTAIEKSGMNAAFTLANADTNGQVINRAIEAYAAKNTNTIQVIANMGVEGYLSAMRNARAVVGNSSSGIIEAASFKTPVVNIGNRQKGREQSANIINCGNGVDDIVEAIETATSGDFRKKMEGVINVYGDGDAAEKIIAVLRDFPASDMLEKKFCLVA